jgi:hypothetical protein
VDERRWGALVADFESAALVERLGYRTATPAVAVRWLGIGDPRIGRDPAARAIINRVESSPGAQGDRGRTSVNVANSVLWAAAHTQNRGGERRALVVIDEGLRRATLNRLRLDPEGHVDPGKVLTVADVLADIHRRGPGRLVTVGQSLQDRLTVLHRSGVDPSGIHKFRTSFEARGVALGLKPPAGATTASLEPRGAVAPREEPGSRGL